MPREGVHREPLCIWDLQKSDGMSDSAISLEGRSMFLVIDPSCALLSLLERVSAVVVH